MSARWVPGDRLKSFYHRKINNKIEKYEDFFYVTKKDLFLDKTDLILVFRSSSFRLLLQTVNFMHKL